MFWKTPTYFKKKNWMHELEYQDMKLVVEHGLKNKHEKNLRHELCQNEHEFLFASMNRFVLEA